MELAVHNDGPVIPAEDRAILFEPFSRAISVRAAAERGWGLGLTLVKGCVEAHGGAVEIESEPEKGTTFTLRFPSDARPFQPRADRPLARRLTPRCLPPVASAWRTPDCRRRREVSRSVRRHARTYRVGSIRRGFAGKRGLGPVLQ